MQQDLEEEHVLSTRLSKKSREVQNRLWRWGDGGAPAFSLKSFEDPSAQANLILKQLISISSDLS